MWHMCLPTQLTLHRLIALKKKRQSNSILSWFELRTFFFLHFLVPLPPLPLASAAYDCYFLYICSSLQHWINISTSIDHSVEWPEKRMHHAATHLSGSLFVIVGGEYQYPRPLNDMWLCDTTTKLWKKVLFLVTILPYTNTPTTIIIVM